MSSRDGSQLLRINGLWTEPLLQRWRPGIHEVAVETSGDAQDQEPGGRLTDNLEAVGDAAGQEDERALSCFKLLIAAFEEKRSFQDIEHLAIAVVDVPWRRSLRCRQDLDQTQGAAS